MGKPYIHSVHKVSLPGLVRHVNYSVITVGTFMSVIDGLLSNSVFHYECSMNLSRQR